MAGEGDDCAEQLNRDETIKGGKERMEEKEAWESGGGEKRGYREGKRDKRRKEWVVLQQKENEK